MSKIANRTALCLVATIAVALPAFAQENLQQEDLQQEDPQQENPPANSAAPEIDWSRLNVDAFELLREKPQPGNVLRPAVPSDSVNWNRTENRNGSANVAQKQSWSSGIATNVGVDSVGAQQGWTPPGTAQAPGSGAGWASAAIPGIGLIDQTTLDARLDPDSDQRKFGARFEKSIPLNPQFSVTLQNGYGVSQPLAAQTITGAAPPSQIFDSEQRAKLNVLNSGTSLFAGSKQSSADDRRLNSFGAEQNLLGGLSLSGAVSENPAGGHDRSLTARFRRSW